MSWLTATVLPFKHSFLPIRHEDMRNATQGFCLPGTVAIGINSTITRRCLQWKVRLIRR